MSDILSSNDSDFNLAEAIEKSWRSKQASLCTKCHKELRLYDNVLCISCVKKAQRYPKEAERKREQYLQDTYNLTLDEYNLLLFQQCGVCAVCGKSETAINPRTGEIRKLSVDHNHITGEVRELLCNKCNILLGFIESDRQLVKRLEKYLKKHDK